jgi:transcriptional regulator with XRE-family HTH domain
MSLMSNWLTTATELGQSPRIPSNVWRELAESKEFREEFSALQLKRGVAFQIRALLKKRGWTQGKLAENAKLTQGVVSRAQDPNYGNLTVNTINRVAAGFDVAFIGLFVPFGLLVEWFENLSEELGEVEPFEDEYRQLVKGRRSKRYRRPPRRRPQSQRRTSEVKSVRGGNPLDYAGGQPAITLWKQLRLFEPKLARIIPLPSSTGAGRNLPGSLNLAPTGTGGGRYAQQGR